MKRTRIRPISAKRAALMVERTNEIKRAWMTEIPGVVMVLFAAPTHEGGDNE